MLWTTMITDVLRNVNESVGLFHDQTHVRQYLAHAQTLLSMIRGLTEITANMTVNGSVAYAMHQQPKVGGGTFVDYIRPIRISMNGVVLPQSSLESVSLLDPYWQLNVDQPEMWFPWGGTHLTLYPIPTAGTVTLTYHAVPTSTAASPTIQENWQDTLKLYAEAVCLAKESQLEMAQARLKAFADATGLLDVRFLDTNAMAPRKATSEVILPVRD